MFESGMGVLLLLGIGVFGGMLGAWLFQRLRIPQVVGYIAIGVLIGQSGFRIIKPEDIEALQPLNLFALGIIGFLVGGEIQMATLRKYARQFTAILLGEGILSFVLVGGSTYVLLWLVLRDVTAAAAGAVVLGAISSATDPASTIDVLWENRARGTLTTAIVAIVALDDALAMLLYGLGTSVAQLLAGEHASILHELGKVAFELIGAIVVGVVAALILNQFLRWSHKPERALSLAIGILLLTIGTAAAARMDVILAAMSLGFVLTNVAHRRSRDLFETARSFAVPIYVLFFVLVGARLGIADMPPWLWGVVAAYVICRSAGKIIGAWAGATYTRSEPVTRKYLGVGLFAQGGVAVGLSIMAAEHLSGLEVTPELSLGDLIIFTVTATTLVVQVTGPPLVKWAIRSSGEADMDITEDDVTATLKVTDVMDPSILFLEQGDSVRRIMNTFAEHEQLIYPVIGKDRRIVGTISPEEIRGVLSDDSTWEWLLADDIMAAAPDTLPRATPLHDALTLMRDTHTDVIPVVEAEEDPVPVGMLRMQRVRKKIADELLRRQQAKHSG